MAQLLSNFGADLTGLRQGASCAAREKTPFFLQPIRVCRHALGAEFPGPDKLPGSSQGRRDGPQRVTYFQRLSGLAGPGPGPRNGLYLLSMTKQQNCSVPPGAGLQRQEASFRGKRP